MPVFKRNKQSEISKSEVSGQALTKKTATLGLATLLVFILVLLIGLPLLIKFSVFLGENRKNQLVKEIQVLPPTPPRIILPFEATPSAAIDLTGFAEKGGNVEIYLDGKLLTTKKADSDGEFVFKNVSLKPGVNTFWAFVYLNDKNKSEGSKKIQIIRDETDPLLELTNPSEDKLSVDLPDFDLVGKTEPGVTVNVNNYIATVNSKGEFKLKLQLSPGKNEYEIKVKDLAGNTTKKKVVITYDI